MKKKVLFLYCVLSLAVGSGGVDAVVGDKITLLIPLFFYIDGGLQEFFLLGKNTAAGLVCK